MATPTARPSSDRPEDRPSAERRRAPRYPSDLETACRPLTARDGSAWPARVVNISANGISLQLPRRFEAGAVLCMDLEDPARTASRTVFARVVHVRAGEGGAWVLGCAFTGELDDDELRAFRAERVRPEGQDCRAWVRFDCDVATTCRDAADPGARPVPVRVVNIAPGGVGLLGDVPWEKGAQLWLQLPGVPGRPGRLALVRVVQPARQAGGRWAVGCEFADAVGDDDLRGLLR